MLKTTLAEGATLSSHADARNEASPAMTRATSEVSFGTANIKGSGVQDG